MVLLILENDVLTLVLAPPSSRLCVCLRDQTERPKVSSLLRSHQVVGVSFARSLNATETSTRRHAIMFHRNNPLLVLVRP